MEKEEKENESDNKENQITYNIDAHDSIMIVKWDFGFKKST